ncbi:hypothetical protein [Citrobacter sp. Cf138]|uniref:hypothetical protein n=1 Tax=Citrobacter sp. Cf138 TaxID=2985082 RepID=UPI002578293A|nr:hypothetical protein [Citrobacter sp. Cf138]MDM3077794.1 hypothetical protein [Citrobacter sp. Cf138]
MSAITKEFTKEQLQQIIETDHVQCGEASSLARIALASLEAEAAGTFRKGPCGYYPSFHEDAVPLYTAPPEPVSVHEDEQYKPHPVMAVKGELGFLDHFDRIIGERDEDIDIGQLGSSNYEALLLAALDAFRAAMLQGADGTLTNEDTKQVGELVMWVKRLAHSLRKANPDSKLQSDAMDYLSRKGLIGVEDILR